MATDATGVRIQTSVRRNVMSVHTQLVSATAIVRRASTRAAIGWWPNAMKARIGNWPDPMGRADSAAGR